MEQCGGCVQEVSPLTHTNWEKKKGKRKAKTKKKPKAKNDSEQTVSAKKVAGRGETMANAKKKAKTEAVAQSDAQSSSFSDDRKEFKELKGFNSNESDSDSEKTMSPGAVPEHLIEKQLRTVKKEEEEEDFWDCPTPTRWYPDASPS